MSASPPPSALDQAQIFPVLSDAQMERIRAVSQLRHFEPGEVLFRPNDINIPFFAVLSGEIEVVQPTFDGERRIATHGPGQFTGEISMISAQRSLALGRVTEAGEFLELSGDGLRALVAKDADLSDVFMRAFILRRLELIRRGFGNVVLLGSQHSAQTLALREFLTRNGHPYTYVDLEKDTSAEQLLNAFSVKASDVPIVICNGRDVLRNPSIQQLANCIGFNARIDGAHVRDVIIVGGGPAGLAAAVYAASEGLDVLVIETQAPGGQAGSSSKIENYLGFPMGLSGMELAARALTQAQKFGAQMMVARSAVRLECRQRPYRIVLDTGEELGARTVVIATGAQYNKPHLPNLEKFENEGIYYGATYIESQLCGDEEVAVVGGGNSAGQAAAFLSQTASKLHMMVRAGELSSTMSRYLIQRLTENPRIEIHYNTEITGLDGGEHLERVTWRDRLTGETSTHPLRHVFIMTGASPRTEWLRGCIALDDKGFVITGRDLDSTIPGESNPQWSLGRVPQMLETSLPAVFAVGDVRATSVKRVASAVGEGAISIHMVHRALAEV